MKTNERGLKVHEKRRRSEKLATYKKNITNKKRTRKRKNDEEKFSTLFYFVG